jgi:hypothetical protein
MYLFVGYRIISEFNNPKIFKNKNPKPTNIKLRTAKNKIIKVNGMVKLENLF